MRRLVGCLLLLAPSVGLAAVPSEVESAAPTAPSARAVPAPSPAEEEGEGADLGADDDSDADDGLDTPEEVEGDGGLRYSADLPDPELERRFVDDLPSLGSMSVGLAEAGRVINGVQLPPGEAWDVVSPDFAWGTLETIQFLQRAAASVREQLPGVPRLRVNHISKPEGGYLRPHKSHQAGIDVDLGFYYREGVDHARLRGRRENLIDLTANWALVKALATQTDARVILVDKRVIQKLYQHALATEEDKGWVDALFRSGAASLLRHARGHRDHFHVRFYSARAQELGRRVQPLLAKRPDQNLTVHRVRRGETLGHIARHYGSTVKLIQKANGMKSSALRVGRTLNVPLRGPCTRCPVAPPLLVPPRRLPQSALAKSAPAAPAPSGSPPSSARFLPGLESTAPPSSSARNAALAAPF